LNRRCVPHGCTPPATGYNAPMAVRSRGPSLEGRVRDIVDSGESVVETEAGVVLVRGGLPGEQVRVRPELQRQGVRRGSLLEVLTPSAARIDAECPLSDRCGGCPLMRLSLAAQRELKRERVARALAQVSGDVPVQLESIGRGLGYRRRARLAFRRLSQRSLFGYRESAGNAIVDVERCLVLEPPLQAALTLLRERLGPVLEGSGEIELATRDDGRVVAEIVCDAPVSAALYAAAEAAVSQPPLVGVALRVGEGAPARFGELSAATPGLFAQANAEVNRRLNELVVELAEPCGVRVVELYAGQGNFSRALAERASTFCAVEGNPAAAEICRAALRPFAQARVLTADANQLGVLRANERADVVVLDPPRAGAKQLAEIVRALRVERVVYVSCHMTTLARDLKALAVLGFRADRAHALDMFPQTAHVEAVVRLTLPSSAIRL
jgi:23S rRNA (uracil1939-C5)-methyltransferase